MIQFVFIATVKVRFISLRITGITSGQSMLMWGITRYVSGSWMIKWSIW